MEVVKQYLNGFLNADDEANAVQQHQIINAENFRFSKDGRWENVPSNELLHNNNILPDGVNYCIGQVADEAGRYIVYFNYNNSGNISIPNKHKIFLHYLPDGSFWTILAGELLNFSKDHLISARIIDGVLYWTDKYNEPRRINIGAAIKYYIDPLSGLTSPVASNWQFSNIIDIHEYTVIRRPPCLPPTIVKDTDSGFSGSQISDESFQFSFQYIYQDGETSVLSPRSIASKINTTAETFNRVVVTMPLKEKISQTVKTIRLVVRYQSTGKFFVVKQWSATKDSTVISNHNAGTTALSYNFYNNIVGETIDDVTSATLFHSVPIKSKSIAVSKNRLFLGSNIEGYDAPAISSLSVTPVTASADSNVTAQWFEYQYFDSSNTDPDNGGVEAGKYVYFLPAASPAGWYYTHTGEQSYGVLLSYPYPPDLFSNTPPSTLTLVGLIFGGATLDELRANIIPATATEGSYSANTYPELRTTGHTTNITGYGGGSGSTGSNRTQYKTGADYQFGIVFYDYALRNCGVVTMDSLKVHVPRRTFVNVGQYPTLGWQVSNTNAATEIPSWAAYYSIVRTMNLKTRFFLQSTTGLVKYFKKNTDGTWADTAVNTFNLNAAAIAIDTTALLQANLGYSFNEGDVCVLFRSDGVSFELPILGIDGNNILIKAADIGNITSNTFIFELNTPFKPSDNEPFYEVGAMYPIENGKYSKTSGEIPGDIPIIGRVYNSVGYDAEAMCFNDKYWQRFDTDIGRINIVSPKGSYDDKVGLRFSDTFIAGTDTNGLSAFEALNHQQLPIELGEINSLVEVSKLGDEAQGSVMLAVGKGGCRTASIYVGITQVTNADNSNYFIKSDGVIGQVNILKGDYGTNNPESIIVHNGDAFWFDSTRGKFVEYSANGLDDISEGQDGVFKFSTPSALLGQKMLSTLAATIEGYGSRPFMFGGIDPDNKELYWSIPKLDTAVPKGQLSDYVTGRPAYVENADYPYDIIDYKAKTLVFCLRSGRWMGSYSWTPEGFITVSNKLYSLKNGELYRHGAAGFNNFYGADHKSKLMIVCNKDNFVKEFKSIALESIVAPEWVHIRSEYPYEQSSDLIASDFAQKEGVYYADFMRDRLSPINGTVDQKQINGYCMREKAAKILIQFSGSSPIWLRLVTIGYNQSTGHY